MKITSNMTTKEVFRGLLVQICSKRKDYVSNFGLNKSASSLAHLPKMRLLRGRGLSKLDLVIPTHTTTHRLDVRSEMRCIYHD